ncbi:MAG: choice-of-anchor D domain-containing protein, partial [Robiginitomaculum sp.]|nr:choice-of-anchor D domain-containing protein [Robiginitomaculum sp.]
SSSDIRARRYDANGVTQGPEFLVNSITTGGQSFPRIAGLSNGDFVITWTDNSRTGADTDSFAIRARQYNANGVEQGPEFLVNSTTANAQDEPDIASFSNGSFVITWRDLSRTGGDLNSFAIRADIFQNANDAAPGGEFLVNTTTAGSQQEPDIAELSNGDFVITWGGSSSLSAQRYNANGVAQGIEFLVSTNAISVLGFPIRPSIAKLSNGGFVITWSDNSVINSDVHAQRYDANGVAQGAEFMVNSTTTGGRRVPSITGLGNGGFVISWEGNSSDIRAQRYDANGLAQGAEFLVNTTTTSPQVRPNIAGLGNGGFVITWVDNNSQTGNDTSNSAIRAQRYDANGVAQGGEFLVNTTTARAQDEPSIASLSNGDFVITWTDNSDTSDAVRAQRYNTNGVAQGGELLVNTTVPNNQDEPSIAGLGNGGFVITWQDNSQTGNDISSSAIRAQRYDANGVTQGGEFLVNTTITNGQYLPSIAGLSNGSFVITWMDLSATGGDTSGSAIRARQYNANDVASGGEFLVNTITTNDQLDPSITKLSNDDFVIVWADNSQMGGDASNQGIRAQRYNANSMTQGNEFLVNTATTGSQQAPSIAGLENGGFVITWTDNSESMGDTDNSAVRAQRYAANGIAQDPEFLVNTTTASDQFNPSIAGLVGGGFVITWQDFSQLTDDTSGLAVRAQRYDANGVAQGDEFLVNTTTPNAQLDPSIAGLGNGDFVITWQDFHQNGGDVSGSAIRADSFSILTPEIAIAGNGVSIADGDVTPAVADDTDFGAVALSESPNVSIFTITNFGDEALNLTGTPRVSITGANAADFILLIDLDIPFIFPGGTNTFAIAFVPRASGVRTASVSIANNDADENPYNFNISGVGEVIAPVLFSSVLPSARSGFIGGPAITVFASVINATAGTARNCRVVIPGAAPVTLSYQPTDATNAPVGAPEQLFDIPGNEIRSFVLAFTPTAVSTGEDVFPDFMCDNANVGAIPGVNTVFLSVDTVAGPDILSINATPSGDGIISIPSGGASFMTVSVINIGAGDTEVSDDATITTSVDTGAAALPLLLQICETNSVSVCVTPLATSITDTIGSVPSFFAVFVTDQSTGGIALDPANARVFLRFTDAAGTVRSVTSAAVTVAAPADAPIAVAGELPLGRWAVTVRTVTSPFQHQTPGVLYVTADGVAELNYGETVLPFTLAPTTDPGNFLTQTETAIIVGVFEPKRSIALVATNPQTHLEIWGVQDTRIEDVEVQ